MVIKAKKNNATLIWSGVTRIIVAMVALSGLNTIVAKASGGESNYVAVIEWIMQWAYRGGIAAAFIGALMIGMAYFSEEAHQRMNGLKLLIVGCACIASRGIFVLIVYLSNMSIF